mgnify:CR=1 FL=1
MAMKRHLLLEMATYDEKDVFAQNAVASVSTEEVKDLEGNDLTICVYKQIKSIEIPKNYHLQPTDIGTIIKHHCGHRDKKKAALLALPAIINAQYVTQAWRKKTSNGKIVRGKDKRPSGMISAPILIDGVKYLCNITQKLALNGDIFPYALALKDENGNLLYKNGRTPVYPLLYAQVTRRFKGWDVYVGAENLTNFRQKNVILGSVKDENGYVNAFQPSFDASCVWGPLMGIKAHVGFRFTLWKKG